MTELSNHKEEDTVEAAATAQSVESIPKVEDPQTDETLSEEESADLKDEPPERISHFQRPDLSLWWRYGMLVYLLGTLALLLASDIGSGIQAITVTIPAASDVWSQPQETILADESIFSSVRQLWDQGSIPLAIFIGITSIAWPYVKMLLTIYAWVAPFDVPRHSSNASSEPTEPVRQSRCSRKCTCTRERLIEILDLLGKWSFADVLVFCQLVVAFRATVPVGAGTTLEVYMVALWGFYGFVVASMLGLIATHLILYHHRNYLYEEKKSADEGTTQDTSNASPLSNTNPLIGNSDMTAPETNDCALDPNIPDTDKNDDTRHWTNLQDLERYCHALVLLLSLSAYLVGCSLPLFEISRQRGDVETTLVEFSIVSMGTDYVGLTKDSSGGDRWIQIMWFFLTMVMPLISTLLLCCVLLIPVKQSQMTGAGEFHRGLRRLRQLYLAAEFTYCWSCMEVIVLATLFAVQEIPKVGSGMVDSGCNVCFVIGSKLLLPAFLPLLLGALIHFVATIRLFGKIHPALYSTGTGGTGSDSLVQAMAEELP